MSSYEADVALIDVLPNETLLRVFKFLDARSLLSALRVCQRWKDLSYKFETLLWKHLCRKTHRIEGNHTEQSATQYAVIHGWKDCYYWITSADLSDFEDAQALTDSLLKLEGRSILKRMYIISRGLEKFPTSTLIHHEYADLLSELPDSDGSWNMAGEFYRRAIQLAKEHPKINEKNLLFTMYRYSSFLANHMQDYKEADASFKRLIRLAPGNSWILERYAEFITERLHRYNLSERIYRLILNAVPSGSTLSSYAFFLWQYRRNYSLALKCFKLAAEVDMERVYFLTNFVGRFCKDEILAKELLEQSKLYNHVKENPDDEQTLFSLALAYHQIHCADEAEQLYRKHMKITNKLNTYTASNLAELLVHSRSSFDEAEQLYMKALETFHGCSETIEIALAGLMLAQDHRQHEGLERLERLLESRHIRVDRTSYTEGSILRFIHSRDPLKKRDSLAVLKRQLITEHVRPRLILMFDANLRWAKRNNLPDYDWIVKLAAVYNSEQEIETLDAWDEWDIIEVPLPPEDSEVQPDELRALLSEEMDDDAQEEQLEEEEEMQE